MKLRLVADIQSLGTFVCNSWLRMMMDSSMEKESLPVTLPDGARFGQFMPGGAKPLMAMIEVTNRCNMDCPVCFSDANHPAHDVPRGEIRRRLERLLEVSGTPIPLQISGGEPTVRKDLPEIVALAKGLGVRPAHRRRGAVCVLSWICLKRRPR